MTETVSSAKATRPAARATSQATGHAAALRRRSSGRDRRGSRRRVRGRGAALHDDELALAVLALDDDGRRDVLRRSPRAGAASRPAPRARRTAPRSRRSVAQRLRISASRLDPRRRCRRGGVIVWPTCGTSGAAGDVSRQAGDRRRSGQRGRRQRRREREQLTPARLFRFCCRPLSARPCVDPFGSSCGADRLPTRCSSSSMIAAARHRAQSVPGRIRIRVSRTPIRVLTDAAEPPDARLIGRMSDSVVVVGNGVSGLRVRRASRRARRARDDDRPGTAARPAAPLQARAR